jgi:hypothetical protein
MKTLLELELFDIGSASTQQVAEVLQALLEQVKKMPCYCNPSKPKSTAKMTKSRH